tara:strand:+ start:208 stop:492 length:285 start_codon:yes stop_codon:yes gene_type:complete
MKTISVLFLLSITFISCLSIDDAVDMKQFRDGCIEAAKEENITKRLSQSEAEIYCSCVMNLIIAEYGSLSDGVNNSSFYNMTYIERIEFQAPCL